MDVEIHPTNEAMGAILRTKLSPVELQWSSSRGPVELQSRSNGGKTQIILEEIVGEFVEKDAALQVGCFGESAIEVGDGSQLEVAIQLGNTLGLGALAERDECHARACTGGIPDLLEALQR